jgi:hypothetical protein
MSGRARAGPGPRGLRARRWGRRALLLVAVATQVSCAGSNNNGPIRCLIAGATPQTLAATPGKDLRDLYVFPSPVNADNVVLAMTLHPFIPAGQGGSEIFDPNVGFEFRIDTTGDAVEDLVILARFDGTSVKEQQVRIIGPAPRAQLPLNAPFFHINQVFVPAPRITAFAGAREDPFFFDLGRFFELLPDRGTPLTGMMPPADADQLQGASWNPPGRAQDFFKGLNVLAIVVELPRALLGGGTVRVWATDGGFCTDGTDGSSQVVRRGRPLVSTVFADVKDMEQTVYNNDVPSVDPMTVNNHLGSSIMHFMSAAGRSAPIIAATYSLFAPDVLIADLSQPGPAGYLGVETRGALGGRFGGRGLTDDAASALFGIIFGDTIPRLGLAPDDGREVPALTNDNVGPGAKHFTNVFPYLGDPQ